MDRRTAGRLSDRRRRAWNLTAASAWSR